MNKKALIATFFLFITLVAYFALDNLNDGKELNSDIVVTDIGEGLTELDKENIEPIHVGYSKKELEVNCKDLEDTFNKNIRKIEGNEKSYFKGLVQEYGSDPFFIAYALLTDSFRSYRLQAELTDYEENIRRREKSLLGENLPEGFSLVFGPDLLLEMLNPASEVSKVLDKKLVLAEEVGELIKSGKASSDEIVTLMSHIENIDQPYGRTRANFEPRNLLESIIKYGNDELFYKYIELGGGVSNNKFSVNPMEFLIFSHPNLEWQDKNGMFKYFLNLGLPVRIMSDENFNYIGGYFLYNLPKSVKRQSFVDLGLTLLETPNTNASIDLDTQKVQGQLEIFLNRTVFDPESNYSLKALKKCRIKRLDAFHANKSGFKRVEELEKIFSEADELLHELNLEDPSLVTCYMTKKHVDKQDLGNRPRGYFSVLREVQKGNYQSAFETFKELDNSNNIRSSFMKDILLQANGTKSVRALLELGFEVQTNELYWTAKIKNNVVQFLELFNIHPEQRFDTGLMLLDYAASECNIDLINYIYDSGVRYQEPQYGENAIDFVIKSGQCDSEQERVDGIKALLKFDLEITNNNLRSIAELKLRDIKLYKTISKEIPELVVAEAIAPSPYRCSLMNFY